MSVILRRIPSRVRTALRIDDRLSHRMKAQITSYICYEVICLRLLRQFKREVHCADERFVLLFALTSLLIGGLSALIGGGHSLYYHICLPRFAPAPIAFLVIWTVIYLAIGVAAGIVCSSVHCSLRALGRAGLIWWLVGLILNFLWFPLFFGSCAWLISLLLIPLMILTALLTAIAFARRSLLSALIMFLYVIWLFFCFLLQLIVILCN